MVHSKKETLNHLEDSWFTVLQKYSPFSMSENSVNE